MQLNLPMKGELILVWESSNKLLYFKIKSFQEYWNFGWRIPELGFRLKNKIDYLRRFSQVSGGYTKKYGGTGLGLVISQKLVQTMGGTVKFYSLGEGLGSTVTFTLPLYQEPHSMKN